MVPATVGLMVPRLRNEARNGRQPHGHASTETIPDTAKKANEVRMTSATPSGSSFGRQLGDPLDRGRSHADVEQSEVADDGQQHDPQPVGAGTEVAEEHPGEDQAGDQPDAGSWRTGRRCCGTAGEGWRWPLPARRPVRAAHPDGAFAVHRPRYLPGRSQTVARCPPGDADGPSGPVRPAVHRRLVAPTGAHTRRLSRRGGAPRRRPLGGPRPDRCSSSSSCPPSASRGASASG